MILAIFIPTINAYKKAYTLSSAENGFLFPLKCAPYIYYPRRFKKDQAKIQALLNFDGKINTIAPTYIASLDPEIKPTNVKTQKINDSIF